jgi:hypothetical protein
MKKLLLIGAMLIVGATSFSASVYELTKTGGAGTPEDPTQWSGEGNMPINSTGTILDATGKAMLVITPVTNAGPDGESMLFDFGSVTRGKELKQIGKFTAEVMTKKDGEIVKADLSKAGTSIEVKLFHGSLEGANGGKSIAKFTVTDPAVAGTKNKLVDLSYQLSGSNGLTNSGKTYSGEILATAYRPEKADTTNGGENYISGRFDDKSVTLQVKVSGVEDIVTVGA